MAHRVAPEGDFDNIWYYVAKESGSIEIADRLIDSICQRFYLLACHPHVGRRWEGSSSKPSCMAPHRYCPAVFPSRSLTVISSFAIILFLHPSDYPA
jgi:hypothetical protein